MAMDWVRCNSCFFLPTPHTKFSLYLTSCGHIVCSNCCTKALIRAPSGHSTPNTLPACLVCHKTCSPALLGKEAQLNKDIMFYFTDPVVVLKKLQQAAGFQRMNGEKQTEWQRQKIILDKITKARKHRENVAIVQSHFEANHHRLLQVLEAVRQKAASVGVQPRVCCVTSQSAQTTTTRQRTPQTPMDTSTDPSSSRTRTSSGQSVQDFPSKGKGQSTLSNTHSHMLGGQSPGNGRIQHVRRMSSSTTPRGSLSSAVVTPSGGIRPSPVHNIPSPNANRQQVQSPQLQSISGCQNARRTLPQPSITPQFQNNLQPGYQSVETERGIHCDPGVSMNLLSQHQMQKQAQRQSLNQPTSTPRISSNTPSMLAAPQSIQQRNFPSVANHSLPTPRPTSTHTTLTKHTVHRMIPNLGQLRTPLSTLTGPNPNLL